ncbi:MAG TPA: hypothetical protein VMV49_08515, partial [Candidatus Deferrimicrobium sp.]|nr:hypothetical protein [Candidatus Deferrimicrobium sp.]
RCFREHVDLAHALTCQSCGRKITGNYYTCNTCGAGPFCCQGCYHRHFDSVHKPFFDAGIQFFSSFL